jgi:hypothetical protein
VAEFWNPTGRRWRSSGHSRRGHRLLTSMGVACDVVALSLIPKGASDKVKTDAMRSA